MAINPLTTRSTLYCATAGDGVFVSIDEGQSWNPLNTNLTNLDVQTLLFAYSSGLARSRWPLSGGLSVAWAQADLPTLFAGNGGDVTGGGASGAFDMQFAPTAPPTATDTLTPTVTATVTASPTASDTPTVEPTATESSTATPSFSVTPTNTATASSTATFSATPTVTATVTATFAATPTATSTATATATATEPTPTATSAATSLSCSADASANACIPGGGSRRTDCHLELQLQSIDPLDKRIALRAASCHEGDPRCDADPDLDNRSCTFSLHLCINNSDPRLPDCAADAVQSFEVKRPRAGRGDPVDDANVAALEAQMGSGAGGFGVDIVRPGAGVPGAPNATADLCGNALPIVVPLRSSAGGAVRAARERFKLRVHTAAARDTDTVKLNCLPSTCGNGTIEADHEQCDDGNRANSDGCDQGCQSE